MSVRMLRTGGVAAFLFLGSVPTMADEPPQTDIGRVSTGAQNPAEQNVVKPSPTIDRADAIVIPTRAGGVEYSRVVATLDLIDKGTPLGVVICAARLGTNDLEEAIQGWTDSKVPIWGIIPERVGIAAGPEARLYREGLDAYDGVLRKALRKRSG